MKCITLLLIVKYIIFVSMWDDVECIILSEFFLFCLLRLIFLCFFFFFLVIVVGCFLLHNLGTTVKLVSTICLMVVWPKNRASTMFKQTTTQRILYLLDGFRVYPNRINVVRIYYVCHVWNACIERTNERINRMNVEYVRERMRTESQAGMVLLLFFSPRNVQRCFIIMNGTLWIEMLWYGFMFAAEYFVFAFSVYLLFDYILWFFFLLSLSCVTSLWCLILAICFNMFTFDVRTFYCRLVYIFVRASTQITCYFCYSCCFSIDVDVAAKWNIAKFTRFNSKWNSWFFF